MRTVVQHKIDPPDNDQQTVVNDNKLVLYNKIDSRFPIVSSTYIYMNSRVDALQVFTY